MQVDTKAVLDIMAYAAETEIVPRFRNLSQSQIRTKSSPTDLVTEADEAAEKVLSRKLMQFLPGSTVVGEEAVAGDPSILDRLSGDAPVWIIDPVDGTSFFARGDSGFCVMVALAQNGGTQQGWIYEPISKRTLTVSRGQGVTISNHATVLRPRVATPAEMSGLISTRLMAPDCAWQTQIKAACHKFAQTHAPGCAGIDYIDFLSGKWNFILYRMLHPWDHAIGQLAIEECGASAARFDHSPYNIRHTNGEGLLIATDKASWDMVYQTIFESA